MLSRVVVLGLVCAGVVARTQVDESRMFLDFKLTYGKQYAEAEEATRMACFSRNLKDIDARNAQGDARHAVNQFADLCPEEFAARYLGTKQANRTTLAKPLPAPTADSVDWRPKGAVCPIKNQGQCGSCWSFSATGAMEGACEILTGNLNCLSEQELVSCSGADGNQGCNGGLMDNAFKWVVSNGGIDSESDYPYTSGGGSSGSCQNDKLSKKVCCLSSWTDISQSETDIASACEKNGPIAVAVDAESGWQTYSGGIMKTCTGTQLDHGVLVVGYGADAGTNYWIVKNSWGAAWGEEGYIRLERGTNQCGIKQAASYPIAKNC